MMKYVLLLCCLLPVIIAWPQQNPVAGLLNKAISAEQKARQQDPANYCGSLYEVIKPYAVVNDSLYLQLKEPLVTGEGYVITDYSVRLKDITAIAKDINVFFETHTRAVKIVCHIFYNDGNHHITTSYSSLYFLYLCHERNNENFADEVMLAFKKLGLTVTKTYWYD